MRDREIRHSFNIAAARRRNQRPIPKKPAAAQRLHFSTPLGLTTVTWRDIVDIILLLGIILLVLALLGFSGVIAALESIAVILLIIAVIVIAWRVITGRRPV